jgi:hypothetical protein
VADAGAGDAGPLQHIIFATSSVYPGNLGGLAGADALCESHASSAGLGSGWTALLSTSTKNARDRITVSGTVRNTDGTVLALSAADLWDGINAPVQYDENGTSVGPDREVWTASGEAGTGSGTYCVDWTSSAMAADGSTGDATDDGGDWLDNDDANCDESYSLYCFGPG